MYLRSIDPASDDLYMKLHYVIHCALDAVEEKGAAHLCWEPQTGFPRSVRRLGRGYQYALTFDVQLCGVTCAVLLKRGPGDSQDAYLGLLYPTEDYKVYG